MRKTITILAMLLFMTGGGKEQAITLPDTGPDTEEPVQSVLHWDVSHFPMAERYEMATISDGKIYACRYGEDGLIISVFKTDDVEQEDSFTIPGVTEVKSISVDSEKRICLFCGSDTGDDFWRISPDGSMTSVKDVQVENLGSHPVLKNVYADSNGLYYFWYEMSVPCVEVYEDGEEDVYTRLDRIYVKDQELNTIVYEEVPDSYSNLLVGFAFDEAGQPMLLAKDREGYYVRRVRTTDREKYEAVRVESQELEELESGGFMTFTDDGLLYIKNGVLYRYYLSDSENEKLMDLAGAGIWEEDIIYLGITQGTIEIIDNYESFQWSEYTAITEGEGNRKQLTLGVMKLQPEMREVVAAFNRYQNEVTVEPVTYVENYDYEKGYERLTLDIIQGKAPDLLSVDGIEYENLANLGVFTDLYTFMEQDAKLNRENLISGVLDVYETNGCLYTIAPAFHIHTMWGAGSVVSGQRGIGLEEMMRLLRDNGGDINSIYGFYADETPLTTLCALNMDKFIDWDQRTCDFTGSAFRQTLDFVKAYEGKPHESIYMDIQNGDILLTFGLINSVEDYCLESKLYGEKVQFIGYPTESGTGTAASFVGEELAINAGSGQQEEAWDFIRFYMENGYSGFGFPLEKERFETVLEESLHEETVVENGETIPCAKRNYTEQNMISIQIYKCEPEDVEAVRELVNSISDKFRYDTAIQEIIEEEAAAYLQDQKSQEEVCGIIQNRVQLYLDE